MSETLRAELMQEREATEVVPGKYFVSYFPYQSGPCLGPNPGKVQGMWLFHRQEGVAPKVLEDCSMAILPHPVMVQVMMKCLQMWRVIRRSN